MTRAAYVKPDLVRRAAHTLSEPSSDTGMPWSVIPRVRSGGSGWPARGRSGCGGHVPPEGPPPGHCRGFPSTHRVPRPL
ncbi:hypothetical protein Rhow_007776 [Rhodococcus wratislaviensis]|uniref:Uncharacterized protein n=1 Tax=Rhodococcus wratislaviensis TaxID=44752 RepID=A0A402CIU3_RHOWR|nr:hypothetical protein Rhow_007776 [Rhodococcus wratislaviensis]